MFGFKKIPEPYTTPGNASRGHVGSSQDLDDGTVYASCTCGWSATGRGDANILPRTMLNSHIGSQTNKRRN